MRRGNARAAKRKRRGPTIATAPEIYHVRAAELRRLGLELVHRDSTNAYLGRYATEGERRREYEKLRLSIAATGFSESHPIVIWANRFGAKSAIGDGHHRLSIAIELGIEFVPIRFAYRRE